MSETLTPTADLPPPVSDAAEGLSGLVLKLEDAAVAYGRSEALLDESGGASGSPMETVSENLSAARETLLARLQTETEARQAVERELIAAREEAHALPMVQGALNAIHELLDSGGIPRGTYPDDHVRNLVALYNQRGVALKEAEARAEKLEEALKQAHADLRSVGFVGPGDHGVGDPEINRIEAALALVPGERAAGVEAQS